jgi:hypothetical protein
MTGPPYWQPALAGGAATISLPTISTAASPLTMQYFIITPVTSAPPRNGSHPSGQFCQYPRLAPAASGHDSGMSVTAFQDLPIADRDRKWDGDAAEKRVRKWADVQDEPNEKYRDAHVWYDNAKKDNFTAYKLLIADVIDGKLKAVPRGVMIAGAVIDGARGGINLPEDDVDRVKSHLAKYYKKMDETAPWERS